ncbi:MAG: GTPase activating protein [Caeruleum heppii]|nr:MAG: GTPase activating protein [Caeruleum heppii]
MSGYLSSILTTTTSRYNSLRRTLLSDESDGDTEDDSHISRVLRAYYTEKGRPFPPWLPPDPKAPQPVAPAQYVSAAGGRPTQPALSGRGGGLSDLWDSPQHGQAAQQDSLSLRRGAAGRPGGEVGGTSSRARPGMGAGSGSIVDSYEAGGRSRFQQAPESRPLPSQKAGSYQSTVHQQQNLRSNDSYSPPPLSTSSASSAQDRLKARLLGGRASPSPSPLPSPGIAPTRSREDDRQRPSYDARGESGDGGDPLVAAGSMAGQREVTQDRIHDEHRQRGRIAMGYQTGHE